MWLLGNLNLNMWHIVFEFAASERQDNGSKLQNTTIIIILIMWGSVCILIVKYNNLLAFLIFLN